MQANSTPESIHPWTQHAFEDDDDQQKAFEILVAKFVLTYYDDVDQNDEVHNILGGTQ